MFTKIKHKSGETVLEWRDLNAKESVSHSLVSHEEPRPEFHAAMQALVAMSAARQRRGFVWPSIRRAMEARERRLGAA